MRASQRNETERRAFAVAKVGAERWYWCVWPSQNEVRTGHGSSICAEGTERSKIAAIDAALSQAGADATWTLAKYAQQQYRNRNRRGDSSGKPSRIERLYHDVYDEQCGQWRSNQHRVVKITAVYIIVDPIPDGSRNLGGAADWHADAPVRVARAMLEHDGYAAVSPEVADRFRYDDPFFFSTPLATRVVNGMVMATSFATLGIDAGATQDEIRAAYRRRAKQIHPDRGGTQADFIALQQAYRHALVICHNTKA